MAEIAWMTDEALVERREEIRRSLDALHYDSREFQMAQDAVLVIDDELQRRKNVVSRGQQLLRDGSTEQGVQLRGSRDRTSDGRTAASDDRSRALHTIGRYYDQADLSTRAADTLDRATQPFSDPKGELSRYLVAVGNEHYGTAFQKMMQSPGDAHLRFTPEEHEAVQAANKSASERAGLVTSATGFPLPLTLDPSIIQSSSGVLNPVRSVARTVTPNTHDWTGVSSDGVVASFDPEGSEVSDDTPTLAAPHLTTAMARCFVPVSYEAFDDWGSMQSEMSVLFSDAKDQLESAKFLNGSGTAEPQGLLTALGTAANVTTAGTALFAVADVYTLRAAIGNRFMPRATFAMNSATADTTYRFVARGSTTEPDLMPDGRSGAVLGKPLIEWSSMDTGSTTGKKLIIAGDFSQFIIGDRIGGSVELVQNLFGASQRPTGQRGLFYRWRVGSTVGAVSAFKVLVVK